MHCSCDHVVTFSGKRFKAEFWLFNDKIYVYRCSKWVLYRIAFKAWFWSSLELSVAEVTKNAKRMHPRSVQGLSFDFGPLSESFFLASWVLWGLLNKFDNDLACEIKLLLHLVWSLLCLAQFLLAIKADNPTTRNYIDYIRTWSCAVDSSRIGIDEHWYSDHIWPHLAEL